MRYATLIVYFVIKSRKGQWMRALLPNNNRFHNPISVCLAHSSFFFTFTMEVHGIVWAGTPQYPNMTMLMWACCYMKKLEESIPMANIQNNEKNNPHDAGGETHLHLLCLAWHLTQTGRQHWQKRVGFSTINLSCVLSRLDDPHEEQGDRNRREPKKNGHWVQNWTVPLLAKLGTCCICIS